MKKIIATISCCLMIILAFAQHKTINDPNAQVRHVKSFHAIKVSSGIHLYLSQGNEEAVAVSASDAEYRNRIITEVDDGVLKIYYENKSWLWNNDNDKRHLKAYVSCKTLDALKASSGAYVDVDGAITSGNLNLEFSSGSNFRGTVNVSDLKIEQGSGAEAVITGTATATHVEASSGSSLKAKDLETDHCDARVSSGGTVDIKVKKELFASAHSGGQINYSGAGVIKEISTGS